MSSSKDGWLYVNMSTTHANFLSALSVLAQQPLCCYALAVILFCKAVLLCLPQKTTIDNQKGRSTVLIISGKPHFFPHALIVERYKYCLTKPVVFLLALAFEEA